MSINPVAELSEKLKGLRTRILQHQLPSQGQSCPPHSSTKEAPATQTSNTKPEDQGSQHTDPSLKDPLVQNDSSQDQEDDKMGVMREKLQLAGMKLEVHRAQMEKKGFHKADMLLTDSDDAQKERKSQELAIGKLRSFFTQDHDNAANSRVGPAEIKFVQAQKLQTPKEEHSPDEEGDVSNAERRTQSLKKLDVEKATDLLHQGTRCIEQGASLIALKYFTQAMHVNVPRREFNTQVHVLQALACSAMDFHVGTILWTSAALDLEPAPESMLMRLASMSDTAKEAYELRAHAYFMIADWRMAADDYEMLIATGRTELAENLEYCDLMLAELDVITGGFRFIDHYAVLVLSPSCTHKDVHIASQELMELVEPDKVPAALRDRAENARNLIASAHQALTMQRVVYDRHRSKFNLHQPREGSSGNRTTGNSWSLGKLLGF
mmetsp:Transcript_29841/g.57344  ORF Transcript_29841/g.57344 Transcript_29841/m.57344 type:complete len:437 (+) Transcript_29841:242-1552(+)|eukprot:CAMPEP_0114251534 /NCGR_PEP_ID=MMETSP0058-20121206/15323_1 /TAXON_ID=36894 /ORGANISM="Pyramimonas parkeae, CCMP726" /LENGTH=436 /DNA_ID=CAMNT_0001365345 /DNA_START=242 /DNA_END=1552 /DNA_ORIENTATION=+